MTTTLELALAESLAVAAALKAEGVEVTSMAIREAQTGAAILGIKAPLPVIPPLKRRVRARVVSR